MIYREILSHASDDSCTGVSDECPVQMQLFQVLQPCNANNNNDKLHWERQHNTAVVFLR